MPDQSWTCRACLEDNPPFTEVCRECGVPCGQGTYVRRCSCGAPIDSGDLNCTSCGRKNALLRKALEPDYEVLGHWSEGKYIPNKYPKRVIFGLVLLSTILLLQVVIGLIFGDVAIASKSLVTVHFYGIQAWVICGGLFFFAVSMLAFVIDHFDKRPNEDMYRSVAIYSNDIAVFIVLVGGIFILVRGA